MKTLVVLMFLLLQSIASAATVTLGWSAVNNADKYNIYVDNVKSKTVTESPGAVTVQPGAHVFNVTAENVWGESPKSNTVSTPPAVTAPVITITIQVSTTP